MKALAAMPAVERASGVVVLADADVWSDGTAEAVRAVESGAGWAIPHSTVHRLSDRGTAQLINGDPDPELGERPYLGVMGGGIVVGSRETLLEVPLDPRFRGWGQEDLSHAIALRCLKGPAWRREGSLLHLWHPPQDRLTRRWGSAENRRLHYRYKDQRRSVRGMERLIGEARVALAVANPGVSCGPPRPVGING